MDRIRCVTNNILMRLLLTTFIVHVGRSIPIDNGIILQTVPPQFRTERVCELKGDFDFYLVIDGSTSIADGDFVLLKNWLADTIDFLPPSAKYGVVQFSGKSRVEWQLDACDTDETLATNHYQDCFKKLFRDQLLQIKGTTKIGAALELAERELLAHEGNRPDYTDLLVLITDGVSEDKPEPVAKRLRDQGVKLLVLGIGNVDINQLLAITDNNFEDIYNIENFQALDAATREAVLEVAGIPIPGTGGDPTIGVICEPGSIGVQTETKNPFEGRVYVKNRANEDGCFSVGDGSESMAQLTVGHDVCGTTRRRSTSPPGMFIENTVVFQFHPDFLTKIDQAYRVSCFYMEADKTVSEEVRVSAVSTDLVTRNAPMPVCEYTLHTDGPDGPPARFVLVGDRVVHKWECDDSQSPGVFKMKVVDCTLTDDDGNVLQLLDANGCSIDKFLMGNLDYAEDRLLATVETHAFKFPDKQLAAFQCKVELCVDLEGGCDDTPPVCNATTSLTVTRVKRGAAVEDDQNLPENAIKLQSEDEMRVFDWSEFGYSGPIGGPNRPNQEQLRRLIAALNSDIDDGSSINSDTTSALDEETRHCSLGASASVGLIAAITLATATFLAVFGALIFCCFSRAVCAGGVRDTTELYRIG